MWRALAAAFAVTLFASGQGAPQQSPAQQPARQPTFRTGAELVRIDATVVDGKGLSVTTLTPEDFQIEEDGVAQTIQTFKLIRLDGTEAADPWARSEERRVGKEGG